MTRWYLLFVVSRFLSLLEISIAVALFRSSNESSMLVQSLAATTDQSYIGANASCQGNIIIAAAMGYSYEHVRTFVLSYNASGTASNAQLLLLLSVKGKHDSLVLKLLDTFNVRYTFINSLLHPGNFRFRWIQQYLEHFDENKSPYCSVFSTDIRDAYFQDDFMGQMDRYMDHEHIGSGDHLAANREKYVILALEAGLEGKSIGTCKYHIKAVNRNCMRPLIKQRDRFLQSRIICSGSIFGSQQGMLELFTLMHEATQKMTPSERAICARKSLTDQIILNYIVYEVLRETPSRLKVYLPRNLRSPMLTISRLGPDSLVYSLPSQQNNSRISSSKSKLTIVTHPMFQLCDHNASIPDGVTGLGAGLNYHQPDRGLCSGGRDLYPAYVHHYDRSANISRAILEGIQAGPAQYYGDHGQFVMEHQSLERVSSKTAKVAIVADKHKQLPNKKKRWKKSRKHTREAL